MDAPALRARYLADSVSTATPAQLLVMLYDRLVLDLTRAEEALGRDERGPAREQLMHAQDIILELRGTLDTSVWPGAAGLGQLYGFLVTELIAANVRGDRARVASCRAMVEPLRDAWREAALSVSVSETAPAVSGAARVA